MKKRIPSFLFLCAFLTFVFVALASASIDLPRAKEKPKLYASQCDDDLRRVYLAAIDEAKKSIILIIYSMTDRYIIDKLKAKADEGIKVTVIHDQKTKQYGFQKLGNKIVRFAKEGSGLMHQKILIIDEEKIYLGSANFTSSSLKVHDNLIMGCHCPELCKSVLGRHPYLNLAAPSDKHLFLVGGQDVEFWSFPEEGKEGLEHLVNYLDGAKESIKIAMFTWTHPKLTQALIRAQNRGVNVEFVIDRNQGMGVCKKCVHRLILAGIPTFLSQSEMCHHKLALIDDSILVFGSANWTISAFEKNDDCLVIVHNFTKKQSSKLNNLWKAVRATRERIENTYEEVKNTRLETALAA